MREKSCDTKSITTKRSIVNSLPATSKKNWQKPTFMELDYDRTNDQLGIGGDIWAEELS